MSHNFEDLADEVPNLQGDTCLDGRRRFGLKMARLTRCHLAEQRAIAQRPGNTLVLSDYQPSLLKLKFMGDA